LLADQLIPPLGFVKLNVQVDLTQHPGDLFAFSPITYMGHRLSIGVRRVSDLKGLSRTASSRLLDLGNHLIEGMMIVIEEDHHPWLAKACANVFLRACLCLYRHESTSSMRV